MESFPLYFLDIHRQPSQNQVNLLVKIFCFETETPFKKHVFWSKKFVVKDINSVEQFADGTEVDEFT